MRHWFLLLGLLLGAKAALGQTADKPTRIYHLEAADERVFILAENHGSMAFTTLLKAELTHMSSSVALPHLVVVGPGEKPFVLAIFTPEPGTKYSWHYTHQNQLGVYTGRPPDTSYVYRLPYYLLADTLRPQRVSDPREIVWRPSTYHLYRWQLPPHTPIVAARAGTVVAVKQEARPGRVINANMVYVLHQDGGYACYDNVAPHSVLGQPGRAVQPGDTLAHFSGTKRNTYFWFAVQYPTDSINTAVPVVFRQGPRLLRPK